MTYARRYALMALVGIAAEDDDGEAAQKSPANGVSNGARAATRPAAPSVASANDLRARILKVGEAKRMTKDEITADFANWAEGTSIVQADAGMLTRYLDALNAGTP